MTVTERKRLHNPNQPVGRWIRVDKRLAVHLRDGFRCGYCGTDLSCVADPRHITLDHLDPCERRIARGLKPDHRERNLHTACISCNSRRGSAPIRRFASPGAVDRIRANARKPLARYRAVAKAILAGTIGREDAIESHR